MFNNFFPKIAPFMRYVEKYSGVRGATNYVTIWRIRVACWISKAIYTYVHARAHAPGYPHSRTHAQACTHRPICKTYCFSTATMVSWTRLSITSCVHSLCCNIYLITREVTIEASRLLYFAFFYCFNHLCCTLIFLHLPWRLGRWEMTASPRKPHCKLKHYVLVTFFLKSRNKYKRLLLICLLNIRFTKQSYSTPSSYKRVVPQQIKVRCKSYDHLQLFAWF
jgi:hypothetical protein